MVLSGLRGALSLALVLSLPIELEQRDLLTGHCLWRDPGDAAWARADPASASPSLEREIGTCRSRGAFANTGLTDQQRKIRI